MKKQKNNKTKQLAKTEPSQRKQLVSDEVIIEELMKLTTQHVKENVIKNSLAEFKNIEPGVTKFEIKPTDQLFQLMTLQEFENGGLIIHGFSQPFRTLVINLSLNLQKEFNCNTQIEKATAHLVAQNYVRTLEIQRLIYMLTDRESFTDMNTQRLAILEKSYDRACKQYVLTLQTLKSIKQPPINVIVKAVTANVAGQQVINQETNVIPI